MKARPYIELSRLGTIIECLRRRRKLHLRRGGAMIHIWTEPDPLGTRVHYQLCFRSGVQAHGSAFSVKKAIEGCNALLAKRSGAQSAWLPFRMESL